MDNAYVDGLRQHDNRPRSPVVVPHDMSALRKKILFENTLLEERTLHEFSAGKGDGAGVDTGSAPLKPTPAPSGIPVSTQTIIVTNAGSFDATYTNAVPNIGWDDGGDLALELSVTWRLRDNDDGSELNNVSSDANYIPTTGWTENGSPIAITITAA